MSSTISAKAAPVADDDPLLRGIIAEQLLGMGFRRVCTAGSGRSAIIQLRGDADLNLLVCDLKMPDMDGIRLLREAGKLDRPLAVIVISALGPKMRRAAEQIASGHRLQVLGSLTKPPTRLALANLLRDFKPFAERRSEERAVDLSREDISAALDRGELRIFVQPQIHADTGALAGVEVLTRWSEGRLASRPPSEVIATAESTGIIDRLTDAVLEQAAQAGAVWRRHQLAPHSGVNISAITLRDVEFPERCLQAFSRSGIDPRRVVLEITETALGPELTRSLDVTTRLHLQGFSLSIDDYGTGFSNLSQLKDMPFRELKVDRSFVMELPADQESATIVRSSLSLARALGLRTVAEGVETAEQREWLRRAGCDLLQGYLIARPMPAALLVEWARRHEAQIAGANSTASHLARAS